MNARKILQLMLDLVLVGVSYFAAYLIRFEGAIPPMYLSVFAKTLPLVIAVRAVCFVLFRMYGGAWRYASLDVVVSILKSVTVGTVVIAMGVFIIFPGFKDFPRSIPFIDTLLAIYLLGMPRFAVRMLREMSGRRIEGRTANALIVGAGDAGALTVREILRDPNSNLLPVGFVDNDAAKRGMTIHRIPVLGGLDELGALTKHYGVSEVIIAIPSATRELMRRVVAACEAAHVSFKTLPSLSDIIDGNISVSSIREVRIEDLLGRDIVDIDIESISRYLAGKRVMVVGAGGSIGSEICRQISKFGPESTILVGRGENSIFNIHAELARAYPEAYLPQVIADVSDSDRARRVLERFEPQIIFHAGANKHVPLSELNCEEAIINNVLGTKNVLDEAERIGVERVVYISTDKAAYPVNVMGCTKRIAEMLVLRKKGSTTKIVGVRFGNVLGSRGSVIPVFKRQIAAGGPVTVTDPEMERYFMTIPEAARLVVQAGGIGEAGQLFVLDMGEPVKIVDLAREMIKLSGLEPEKDIRIKSIGIRPGERLSENLVGEGESLEPTAHAKIRAIVGSEIPDGDFEQRIAELERLARAGETKQAMAKLGAFAKGFDLSTVYLQQAESLRQERL